MPNRARLHRLAAGVLLLWLFSLTSGVVNACVVASGLRHAAHAAAVEAAQDHAAHSAHAGPATALDAGQHQHGAEPEQTPCERLCDEPAAPPQADKLQGSPLAGFWLAAAPLPSLAQWPAVERKAPPVRAEAAPHRAISIPIAYLRLAL